MAKGDQKKVQNVVNQQVPQAQNATSNVIADTSGRTSSFQNLYGPSAGQNVAEYGNMMGRFGELADRTPKSGNYLTNFLEDPANKGPAQLGGIGPLNLPAGLESGYQDFAKTGGFTPGGIQDIRARSVAPVHAVGDMLRRKINQQNSIRGAGNSPNTIAALAKSARDTGYSAGDISTNAEANLAQMIQQGRLAGLGGLGNIGSLNLGARGQDVSTRGQDLSNALGSRSGDLAAIGLAGGMENDALRGMTGLYSATPGLTSTFGNQVLNSSNQNLNANQMQGDVARLALGGAESVARTPSTFQNVLGNIGNITGAVGNIAGAFPIPGAKRLPV